MTAENEYRLGRRAFHQNQEESVAVAIAVVAVFLLAGGSYILVSRFHVRSVQLVEGSLYAFFALVAGISVAWYLLTLRQTAGDNLASSSFIYKPSQRPRGRRGRVRTKRNRAGLRRPWQTLVLAGRDAGDAVGGARRNWFRQDHAS